MTMQTDVHKTFSEGQRRIKMPLPFWLNMGNYILDKARRIAP